MVVKGVKMPKRKEIDPPSTTTVKVRIPIKTKIETLKAKEASPYWSLKPELSFFGYLLDLGLRNYQKHVLPMEQGDIPSLNPEETSEKRLEKGESPIHRKKRA